MAFDGIVTKAIASELQQLVGGRIDKIFQPNKNNVILGFYFDGNNYALNICTDSQNYRINLTTHAKPNPQVAPNFCMVLRKHLIGLRIKNIITDCLERIVTIEFEGFDDIDDIITKKLVVELMGKHCNIILLDDENIIIDSLRHINNNPDDKYTRKIIPHVRYVRPSNLKFNFLDTLSFESFKNKVRYDFAKNSTLYRKDMGNFEYHKMAEHISNLFIGISKSFVQAIIDSLEIPDTSDSSLEQIYCYMKQVVFNTDSLNLDFETIYDEKGKAKDYFLVPRKNEEPFRLNFYLDDFYYKKETSSNFVAYRNSVLKLILDTLKKYNKRLININEKLKNCDNMDIYQLYGELITANLYKLKDANLSEIKLENYYDNNKLITIPLDKRYTPSENAKRYFKKYHKLKNTLEIVSVQKEETLNELNYIESIVYELENCSTIEEVSNIFEEISENVIFKEKTEHYKNTKNTKVKKSKLTKNKNASFNPLKYVIDGYTLFVGKNNKENDYLALKFAKKTDIWFHTKDIHGSHAILSLENKTFPNHDILIKCAEIVAYHSQAKNSSNVPVDFCSVKFVKKPNGAKPGMVIYTNQQTLYVNPAKH